MGGEGKYNSFVEGEVVEFTSVTPTPEGAKSIRTGGRAKGSFDRSGAAQKARDYAKLKEMRSRSAQEPAIRAMRLSAEMLSNAHDRLSIFLQKNNMDWNDWAAWFFAQGFADANPAGVKRWSRLSADRAFSDHLYLLCAVSIFTGIPMSELFLKVEQ